jgi:antitoxin ParD1/3/4
MIISLVMIYSIMNVQPPADLEQFVQAKVRSGRFSSPAEALIAALRLLRQQEEAEEARVVEGIRQGLDDMHAGRGRPAEEVFSDIRRDFNLPPGA